MLYCVNLNLDPRFREDDSVSFPKVSAIGVSDPYRVVIPYLGAVAPLIRDPLNIQLAKRDTF